MKENCMQGFIFHRSSPLMLISEHTSNSFAKSDLTTLSSLKKRTRKKNPKKITALVRYIKDAGANMNVV